MKIKALPSILAATILPFMLLLVSSCDKNEDQKDQRAPRVKHFITEYRYEPPFQNSSDTIRFEYNSQNQLIAMNGDGSQESYNFKYNPDGTISEAEFISEEIAGFITFFSWSGNTVTLTESDNMISKSVFELNAERQISRIEYYFLHQDEWFMNRYTINNWDNGNLVSSEEWSYNSKQGIQKPIKRRNPYFFQSISDSYEITAFQGNVKMDYLKVSGESYTHDDKINPLKDVILFTFAEGSIFNSKNNTLSTISYSYDWTGSIRDSSKQEYSYTYNAGNYPLIRSEVHPQYTYNQIFQYE